MAKGDRMIIKFIAPIMAVLIVAACAQPVQRHFDIVDGADVLISKTSAAELVCSIDRFYYEFGDTISVIIKIINCSDTALMLADPVVYPPNYVIDQKERKIFVEMGGDDEGSQFFTDRKIKVSEKDSLIYNLKIPVIPVSITDEGLLYSINFYIWGWVYPPDISYLTEGKERLIDFKSEHDIIEFCRNEFIFWPGQLNIMVVKNIENIHLYPWQKAK